MSVIDPVFFDKKFSVPRYMLRYVVGAATDEFRDQQLQKVRKFRAMADEQIDGVIDQSFVNFNTSLARFTTISNQLQGRYCRGRIGSVPRAVLTLSAYVSRNAGQSAGSPQASCRWSDHSGFQDEKPSRAAAPKVRGQESDRHHQRHRVH